MRVKIARQSWGVVVDPAGNAQNGEAVTITHPDGSTAATVFAGATGETTIVPTTNVRGEIAGYITVGNYLLTVGDLEEEPVEAVHGRKFIPETGGGEGVDARPAFQAAVDRAAAEPYGGTVELQVGLFEYRSYHATGRPTVFVPANVHVVGPGSELCTIRQHMDSPENTAGSAFRVEPAGYDPDVPLTDEDFVRNVVFRGFTYDGNMDEVVRGNGIVAIGMADFEIHDVRLTRCWNTGLSIQMCKDGHVSHIWLKEIGSKENAEFLGTDTSACHGIVTTRANITQPWCERITFSHIIADDVQHSAMRLSSIRDSSLTTFSFTREPESPFYTDAELAEDLEPADTVATLDTTAGSWFPNGSIITIGTDRFEFDTTTGSTLTGVATEDVNEVPRSATYPSGTPVRLGRTSGYGGLRFSNSAHGINVSAGKIKGYRRGIHWAATAYRCNVSSVELEDIGYQAILMNGHHNHCIGFTVTNPCVYASEATGDAETDDDTAAVDSTAVRLANATDCTLIGSVEDDRETSLTDYGVRETGGDHNRIDVRIDGVNLAPIHSDGIHNDLTGSRDDGSNEVTIGEYVPLPYTHSHIIVNGDSPDPFAFNGQTTGASLDGAVLSGVDVINVDSSLGPLEAGNTIIVGTGASGEAAVVDSVDGLEITLVDPLDNNHADAEGVYPFRVPIGHEWTLSFTDTPTINPSAVLKLANDEPFTPTGPDDVLVLVGNETGTALREDHARLNHTHDDRYDTSAEVAAALLSRPRIIAQGGFASATHQHTGNTTETQLTTVTIPAGSMGPNGRIRISTLWTRNAGGAGDVTARLRWSTFGSGSVYMSQAITTAQTGARRLTEISNRSSESSQIAAPVSEILGAFTGTILAGSFDTTVDTTLAFTAQLANAGDTLSLRYYCVEVLYGA